MSNGPGATISALICTISQGPAALAGLKFIRKILAARAIVVEIDEPLIRVKRATPGTLAH
jgi:hypothetical protein